MERSKHEYGGAVYIFDHQEIPDEGTPWTRGLAQIGKNAFQRHTKRGIYGVPPFNSNINVEKSPRYRVSVTEDMTFWRSIEREGRRYVAEWYGILFVFTRKEE